MLVLVFQWKLVVLMATWQINLLVTVIIVPSGHQGLLVVLTEESFQRILNDLFEGYLALALLYLSESDLNQLIDLALKERVMFITDQQGLFIYFCSFLNVGLFILILIAIDRLFGGLLPLSVQQACWHGSRVSLALFWIR